MNARVKTVTAASAHEAVDRDSDWIVVGVVKRRVWLDENRKGWIRRTIVGRADKDVPRVASVERSETHRDGFGI